MENILRLEEFSDRQVERYFKPRNAVAAQCMRYIFNMFAEYGTRTQSRVERHKLAADMAIDHIEWRYNIAKKYMKDFFPARYEVDHEALFMAIICDDQVIQINEPINVDEKDGEVIMRNDGFADDLVCRANLFWDEAQKMGQFGLSDDTEEPMLESVYIAHINALQRIAEIQHVLVDCNDRAEMEEILENDVMVIHSFLHSDKKIGNDIKKELSRIESEIDTLLNAPSLPKSAPSRPYLFVVPKPER